MTINPKRLFLLGMVAASATLLACNSGSSGGSSSSSGDTGQMSLAVTDAPIDDAVEVVIRFTHVELQPADGDRVRIDFDDDEVREIDLLALQGEESEFLFEDEEIPAGEYNWIRFYLEPDPEASGPPVSNFATSSYILFADGNRDNLVIPGGLQQGLQLVSGFTVPAGGVISLTVDFDLRTAIRPSEFEGYHRLRRALRVVDNSEVGVISGAVEPDILPDDLVCVRLSDSHDYDTCPGVAVYVFEGDTTPQNIQDSDGDPVTTANIRFEHDSETGEWEYRYTAGFLSPGTYTVALTFQADDDDPETDTPIDFVDDALAEVFAGERTIVNFPTENFASNGDDEQENGDNGDNGDEDDEEENGE